MADDYDDDQQQNDEPEHIRDLRAKAKRASELEARLAQVEREAAFSRALGPAADHPGAKYFVKGYDGELTVDAIKAAAQEAGFLQAQQQDTSPPPDLEGHQRLARAAAGAPGGAGRDDWEAALREAGQITNPAERENAILGVVERYGGATSRNTQ